ncbi:MAG: hypothetical protein JO116_10205 [Planctomycetaceae bacterium]|nr:hypothetical protein [Planctomycetaceae bacterium]
MRWRRRDWPEREPRPEARTLSDEEKKTLLAGMTKEIASSPVLTGLGLQVRSQRGRFSLERPLGEGDSAGVEAWGRVTPLADSDDLLLEQERRKGSWSEIARGSARELIKAVASDTKGTFHGLGLLDKSLRQAGKGLERLPVKQGGKTKFVYAGTGEVCSPQEALFHYFGLPLHVLVEPSEWYSYHRQPTIVEGSEDRTRVLVRFGAMSTSGESFGGTCLYACRDGRWGAYRIRPIESRNIVTAGAWLVKRKWKQWG